MGRGAASETMVTCVPGSVLNDIYAKHNPPPPPKKKKKKKRRKRNMKKEYKKGKEKLKIWPLPHSIALFVLYTNNLFFLYLFSIQFLVGFLRINVFFFQLIIMVLQFEGLVDLQFTTHQEKDCSIRGKCSGILAGKILVM